MHGEELYNKMVVDLINKMTGSTSNGIGKTPVSAVSGQSSQHDPMKTTSSKIMFSESSFKC